MCVCFEKFDFVITLVSVLKGVTKFVLKFVLKICKCEEFCFKQVPTSIYLLEKNIVSILVSFRQCYPTIEK